MFRFPFIRITLNCLYILYTPERLMNLYKRFTSYIQKNLNNKYYDAAKLAEYFFLKVLGSCQTVSSYNTFQQKSTKM